MNELHESITDCAANKAAICRVRVGEMVLVPRVQSAQHQQHIDRHTQTHILTMQGRLVSAATRVNQLNSRQSTAVTVNC